MNAPMAKMSLGFRKATIGLMGGALLCVTLGGSKTAHAEESTPRGKGIAGGVLLGGELVMAIEAAANVTRPVAYALGALGGGLAGGVGGYFVEQSASNAKVPSYLLAAGVAFLIPSVVLAFDATSYKPPADYQEDQGALGAEPVADAPTASPSPGAVPTGGGGSATPPAQGPVSKRTVPSFRRPALLAAPLPPPVSMVAFQGEQLSFRVPAVEIRPVFSPQELRQFGMAQREEVRIPVFQAQF